MPESEKIFNFEDCTLYGIAEVYESDSYAQLELQYMLSSYLRGETFAKGLAKRGLDRDENSYFAKLFADESAHVELFQSYINETFAKLAFFEDPFESLISSANNLELEVGLLILHMVIEPFGVGSLSYIKNKTSDRKLKAFTAKVITEELEHLSMTKENQIFFDEFLRTQSEEKLYEIAKCIEFAT